MGSDEQIAEDAARFGWSRIVVNDATPCFVYSVGLMYTHKHPELIVFGLPESGPQLLALMVEQIRAGKSYAMAGRYDGIVEQLLIATRVVHPSQHSLYLGYAMGHCRLRKNPCGLQAIQVFWPDRAGVFPFERGCEDEVYHAQKRLDQQVMPDELEEFRRFIGSP